MAATAEELRELALLARESGDEALEIQALEQLTALQEPDPTFGQQALGALETAAAIGSGIIAEPAAGVAGLATSLIPGLEPGAGAGVVEGVKERLTFSPRTEAGQAQLQAVGETLAPLGEALGSAEEFLGGGTLELTGSPALAAAAATAPTAALEALGLGAAKVALKAPSLAFSAAEALPQRQIAFTGAGRAKQRIGELIESGSGDIETAGFRIQDRTLQESDIGKLDRTLQESTIKKLGQKLRTSADDVVTDVVANETIKQGFDPGVIAAVKASDPLDRSKMLKMVNIAERGKKNKRFALKNRPTDVVGNSLMERINVIQSANKSAGKQLDTASKALKGRQVDSLPAVDAFVDDLSNMGITLTDGKPNFAGSDIEGLVGPENAIKNIIRRMSGKKTPDAFDLHRMKKFIDENVTFGKNAEGLSGKTEQVLKSFRRNIDQVLDTNFPEYDAANTAYAETIGALDAIQGVAGKKMDLTGPNAQKATGTLMRRLMSNAQSRVNLVDAIDQIEGVANKYKNSLPGPGGTLLIEDAGRKSSKAFKDDLLSQVLFADELDAVFKPVARTSFEGLIERGVKRATTSPTAAGVAAEAASAVAKKARGITEEAAFKSIKELLKGQ